MWNKKRPTKKTCILQVFLVGENVGEKLFTYLSTPGVTTPSIKNFCAIKKIKNGIEQAIKLAAWIKWASVEYILLNLDNPTVIGCNSGFPAK